MLLADLKRAFRFPRWLGIMLLCVLLLLFTIDSALERILLSFVPGSTKFSNGAVDSLVYAMMIERYKIVMLLLLMSLYTAAYCSDSKTNFLRAELSRCRLKKYVVSKFAANTVVIIITFMAAVFLYTLIFTGMGYRLVSDDATGLYYSELLLEHPVLFLFMISTVFGMHAAACASTGLLFSTYKQNVFVTVGTGALVFFIALAWIPFGSIFSVLKMTAMDSSLPGGDDVPYAVMFSWSIGFPACVCALCCFFSYKRIKRRMDDGGI